MKRSMIAVLSLVAVMLAGGVAQAATMADLLVSGATITSGDKLFSNFHGYSSSASGTGALVVNAADVTVSAFQDLTSLEYGLKFLSTKFVVTGSPASQATGFQYIVSCIEPGYLISDNTLQMTGTGKMITLTETATDAATETILLATKMNYLMSGSGSLYNHQDYAVAVSSAHVATDISVINQSTLTGFTQTFSQVPEPATMAFLALGGIGMLARRRRK